MPRCERRRDVSSSRISPCSGFGIAAQHRLPLERAAGADIVGALVDEPLQNLVAGLAEGVVDAVVLAPGHDVRPAIVAIAADQDAGGRPAGTDAAHEAAQIAADLLARRGLAEAQDHGDRATGRGVIYMDRQKATPVVVGVEERQLLMAVNDINRIVDPIVVHKTG